MAIKLPVPTEHDEAVTLTAYLELLQHMGKILFFSHVPNETFTKSWTTKRKNKAEGVRPGVPDYIIVTPNNVLFLELKRTHGSKTSPKQRAWITHLQGKKSSATIAKGFDEAKTFLDQSLQHPPY